MHRAQWPLVNDRPVIDIVLNKTQARVAKLARKCNEGELTAVEHEEYEFYVMAGEFVAILQAKARVLLARRGQPK